MYRTWLLYKSSAKFTRSVQLWKDDMNLCSMLLDAKQNQGRKLNGIQNALEKWELYLPRDE